MLKTIIRFIGTGLLTIFFFVNTSFAQIPTHVSSITQNLISPVRIAMDKTDAIYVSDAFQKNIIKYDVSGNYVGTINTGGSPISIAFDASNKLYYGDGETGKIYTLNQSGNPTLFYTGCIFPGSMVFGSNNLLYVVDSKMHQVIVLNSAGTVLQTIGTGTLTFPTGIAFDSENNRILVAEHGGVGDGFNPIVKIWNFDLQGNLISSFGAHGNADGKFYRIQGISIGRCGNIYIPDPFQGNVSIFTKNGTFISRFGNYGNTLGLLNQPLDILVDSKDRMWISSLNNGAIERYDITFTLPTSNITVDYATICSGQTTDIPVHFTGTAPWTFTYTINGADSITVSGTSNNPYILTVSNPGTYEVVALSDANNIGTCFSGNTKVTVNAAPTALMTNPNVNICAGQTANISISITGTPPWSLTYTKDNANPITINNITSSPYTFSVNEAGTYQISALSGSTCGTASFSGSTQVVINPLPSVSLGTDFSICEGITDTIDAGMNYAGYLWNDGTINHATAVNVAGNYSVTVTDINGCANSDNINVSVNPNPAPNFNFYSNGLEYTFVNTSLNADTYQWNFGDSTSSIDPNPIHLFASTGDYLVTLTASNNYCDSYTTSVLVSIIGVAAENIFSQNDKLSGILIYPNPTTGLITVELDDSYQTDVTIEITGKTGQLIYSKIVSKSQSNNSEKITEQIDLKKQANGVYTVKIISKDLTKTTKLILMN